MKNIFVFLLLISISNITLAKDVNPAIMISWNTIYYADVNDWLVYKINTDWTNKEVLKSNSSLLNTPIKDEINFYNKLINNQMEVILKQYEEDRIKEYKESFSYKIKNIWDKIVKITSN